MRPLTLLIAIFASGTLHAQSLAEVAKKTEDERARATDAATSNTPPRVYSNKDLRLLPGEEPEPPLTAAEAANIDRTKFDAVYSTSKAMEAAQNTPKFTEARVAFNAAVQTARDKAATKAEQWLVKRYLAGVGQLELASTRRRTWEIEARMNRASQQSLDDIAGTERKGWDLLKSANDFYLGKREP